MRWYALDLIWYMLASSACSCTIYKMHIGKLLNGSLDLKGSSKIGLVLDQHIDNLGGVVGYVDADNVGDLDKRMSLSA